MSSQTRNLVEIEKFESDIENGYYGNFFEKGDDYYSLYYLRECALYEYDTCETDKDPGVNPVFDISYGNGGSFRSDILERILICDSSNINAQDRFGRTALHEAVRYNNNKCGNILIKYGAKQLQDNAGDTPLHLAASEAAKDGCQLLIDNNADYVMNYKGETPLDTIRYDSKFPEYKECIEILKMYEEKLFREQIKKNSCNKS